MTVEMEHPMGSLVSPGPPAPSMLSEQNQPKRGRETKRSIDENMNSTEAAADDESDLEMENAPADGTTDSMATKGKKRRRSRKGLDKKYPCKTPGCGKTYSRAEHLYRHMLNREA